MSPTRGLVLAAALATTLAACGSPGGDDPPSKAVGSTTPTAPSPASTASPSPEPVEEEPVERSGFHGKIDELPAGLAAQMRGSTWSPGCPVPLEGLRLLHFNYWGFGGNLLRGPMVVNASVAEDVLWVFHRLYDARFPIKRVSLSTPFHPKAFALHRRIDSNRSVTASFNCRPVVTATGPGDDFSQHAYGLAIDLNPLQNPYVTSDGFVRNRAAEPYTDRGRHLEGMIHEGDVVVRSFAAIGWAWGGHWSGDKDYMHFSLLGR
ncbi:MAG TPA: M15 family metallopeptidase [Actinomycetota bacterium]|nr:M15 family metallopeptidase [Actinomycetota bacterium]